MAENINVETDYGSWCYDNKTKNCEKYGRLYTWTVAMGLPASCEKKSCSTQVKYPHQGICPEGFHIPTRKDIETLLNATRIVRRRNSVWGVDIGFSLLPAGYYADDFFDLDSGSYLWYSSEIGDGRAGSLYSNVREASMGAGVSKSRGHSVRCLKNSFTAVDVKTVKIGNQVWDSRNLNVETPKGSWCYENKPENCAKFGRLYTWSAAMNLPDSCENKSCETLVKYPHQGACPYGFHVPIAAELGILLEDSERNIHIGWGEIDDDNGFSLLPAGSSREDNFYDLGSYAGLWSSSEGSSFSYKAQYMNSTKDDFYGKFTDSFDELNKEHALSVRCLKNSNDLTEVKTIKIGEQVWMTENLKVPTDGGSSCFGYQRENCEKYGHLYDWGTAMNLPRYCEKPDKKCATLVKYPHQGICPDGFHIPTKDEFNTLMNVAQKHIRANSWVKGDDSFGFSLLPAGHMLPAGHKYYFKGPKYPKHELGNVAYLWTSSVDDSYLSDEADVYYLYVDEANAEFRSDLGYMSVRCLQNSNEGKGSETLRDSRDGKTYKTVKIDNQVWMAENLNYTADESGCYDNKESNCEKYGRLYTWKEAKKACPEGWRLPSARDLKTLLANMGDSDEELTLNLRADSWKNGSDKFDFSALPAGRYDGDIKKFSHLGKEALFWSSTEYYSNLAYYLDIYDDGAKVFSDNKNNGYSVRCVQDSN